MFLPIEVVVFAATTVAALLLTYLVRRFALRSGLLDIPNARSSHVLATPRGGGLVILVAFSVVVFVAGMADLISPAQAALLIAPPLAVGLVGFIDDRRGVPVAHRLVVHLLAASAAVALLPSLPIVVESAWVRVLLGPLCIVALIWSTNLFNFMDGIDGIAGAQAVYMCLAGAWLACDGYAATGIILVLVALAGSVLGFLVWNWAPARIFMGDVGSGYLGMQLGIVGCLLAIESRVTIWTWIILGSMFLADASVTLVRRVLRRQKWSDAHRTHAYQHLSRRLGSHSKATLLFVAVNCAILLPLGWVSVRDPSLAPELACLAILLCAVLALAAGAGRSERPPPDRRL